MLTTTEAYDQAALAVLVHAAAGAGAGPLNAAKVNLFTNNPPINKQMVIGSFTVPAYAGYAAITATWGAATRDSSGLISTVSQELTFQQLAAITPTMVTGYFVTDSAGAVLYFAENFAAPYNLADALSQLNFVIEYIQSNPVNNGGAVLLP